ncbi:uncharacterized protein LOC9637452 [Selaginella moellendorffii]|nr:uncharacterized protein LOC9637452 [Selaginella moellendorffii]|eukprot:XP_002972788.2 uncharacterized protein LOC9637452 [Selaginella moellendorffii]
MGLRLDLPYLVSKKGHVLSPRPIGVKKLKIPKRVFFMLGYPGTGKSTAIASILEKLRKNHPRLRVQGFYQKPLLRRGESIGVESVSVNGPSKIFTSTYPIPGSATRTPPFLGKHRIDIGAFESIALPELKLHYETELFVVDEVGVKELMSPKFYPLLQDVLNSEVPILGTLQRNCYWEDRIKQVEEIKKRKDTLIYKIYKKTTNHTAKLVYQRLNQFFLYRKEEGRDHIRRSH